MGAILATLEALIPKPTITVYHYTDKKGKDAIIKSRYILKSDVKNGDAILGSGVYLTSLGPSNDKNRRKEIAENNWKGIPFDQVKDKTEYVFAVKMPQEKLEEYKKQGRDIYLFKLDLENLLLNLVDEWSLYEWNMSTDVPKVIQTGKFTLPPGMVKSPSTTSSAVTTVQ